MIYLDIGRRERGKSTHGYYMARKVPKRMIIDARQMIQRGDSERVHRAEELRAAFAEMAVDAALNEVVYQPQDDDLKVSFESFIVAAKEIVTRYPRLQVAIMVDEASFYDLESPRFQWLAKCTPRETVHLILTAHRPADIPTSIRAIADHWCIWSTTQEHDLKVIEQRTGSVAVVKAIKRLQGRDYVHWDDARGEMAVCADARVWYVALRAGGQTQPAPKLVDSKPQDFELEG